MCFLWFHKWDKWEEPIFIGYVYDKGIFSTGFYQNYSETRHCKECGRFQMREFDEREFNMREELKLLDLKCKVADKYAKNGEVDKAINILKG